jgi:hypothetical protein
VNAFVAFILDFFLGQKAGAGPIGLRPQLPPEEVRAKSNYRAEAADDYITRRVNSVDLKNRFGDVETDCRDRLHAWLRPHPVSDCVFRKRGSGDEVHRGEHVT